MSWMKRREGGPNGRDDVRVTKTGAGWGIARGELAGPSWRVAAYELAERAADAAIAGLRNEADGTALTVAGASLTFGRPSGGLATAHASLAEDPADMLARVNRDGAAAVVMAVRVDDADGNEVARLDLECRLSRRLERLVA